MPAIPKYGAAMQIRATKPSARLSAWLAIPLVTAFAFLGTVAFAEEDPPAKEAASAKEGDSDANKSDSAGESDGGEKAEPKKEEKKTGIDVARRRMEKGQQLFAQGRYQEAMGEFEAAYEAQPFGAFLFNAAYAAEKAGDRQRAIARYREYLASDPSTADAEKIRANIARLEKELSAMPVPGEDGAGGGDGSDGEGGGGGGDMTVTETAPVPADEATLSQMRSLVFVESEPPGAPLTIHERVVATAKPFKVGGKNDGWRKVVSRAKTPRDLSLPVGHYHVMIEAFQDYKTSATNMNLAPGHVYTFRANLSQGEFLAFLKVKSKVEGARIYVDDPPPHKSAPWGRTPASALVNSGDHKIWVEKAGYVPFTAKVTTHHGRTKIIKAKLKRVNYGYVIIDGNPDMMGITIDEKPQTEYRVEGEAIKIKLPAGNHELLLEADSRKDYEGTIKVPRGQELVVHANLTDSYPRGKAVALGIVSGVLAGGGVFLHLESRKPEDQPHDKDLLKVFKYGSYGAWGTAGLMAGMSIFYAIYDPYPDPALKKDKLRDFPDAGDDAVHKTKSVPAGGKKKRKAPKKSSRRRTIVAPLVGPHGGGLAIGGTF